jgi:hypothetical protein
MTNTPVLNVPVELYLEFVAALRPYLADKERETLDGFVK